MSYPLSADVSAGDITAASQYNNLRADALRLGNLTADAINIGSLMAFYETKLTIVRLATNTVRVAATASAPVGLIVAGVPVRAVANVDLAAGGAPAGAASTYYVFANRVAGSTTFTLSVSTVLSPEDNQQRIGRFYWNGTIIVKDSIQTELSLQLQNLLYFKEPMPMNGRLTLATADPVPADVASSSTLFFTPYLGNRVSLYVDNYGWRIYEFTELALNISTFTTGKNYDIFLYDNAGTLTLEGLVWSNDTLRATALYNQDGRWVKNNAKERLYLGTIFTSAAGTTKDTCDNRFVWNNYNRVERTIWVYSTTSHTYNAATWRNWNDDPTNLFNFVVGLVQDPLCLALSSFSKTDTVAKAAIASLALDTNNAATFPTYVSNSNANELGAGAFGSLMPTLGRHYYAITEYQTTGAIGTFAKVYLSGYIKA